MLWIGITGGIASGKSTFCEILKNNGFTVLHADQITHELMDKGRPAYQEIVDKFGAEILNKMKLIDRIKLGQVVFSDKRKLTLLEKIIHPKVKKVVNQRKNDFMRKGVEIVFYEVPLLFEKKMEKEFDKVITVFCDKEIQIKRVMNRDSLSLVDAEKRINSQISSKEKVKKSDYVLKNNSTTEKFKESIEELIKSLAILS